MPSREDIDSSPWFVPRAACKELEPPEIITEHWLLTLREEGLLMECPLDQFTSNGWMGPIIHTGQPHQISAHCIIHLFRGRSTQPLSVVPPQHPGGTDREYLLTNFHRHGCLVRQSLTVGGKWRQLAFRPYCGIINENADTTFSHVRKHLSFLYVELATPGAMSMGMLYRDT